MNVCLANKTRLKIRKDTELKENSSYSRSGAKFSEIKAVQNNFNTITEPDAKDAEPIKWD